MESNYTICAAVIKNRIESLQQLGVDINNLLDLIELRGTRVNNPEEMIPLDTLIKLENIASELTHSHDVAFRIVDE